MWQRGQHWAGPGYVVAHRAGVALTGGDALAGTRLAVALGAPMIEFDVRATADGVLVVHHDAEAGGLRLAGHRYDQLAEAGVAPPRVVELLAAAGGQVGLDVELKEAGYELEVIRTVLEHAPAEKVVFTSFQDRVVRALADARAGVGVGLLVGRRAGLRTPLLVLQDAFPFERIERCAADFLAPNRTLLVTGLVRRAARRDIGLLVWGVDDERDVARLQGTDGVLGVVTDSREALSREPSFG